MRNILILLVLVGGAASIAFCGSNGWEQGGSNEFEKGVTAFIYGFVAAATLALHVTAVKAWIEKRHRPLALLIGGVAILAFFMTAYISLSGLVSRADRITAARQEVADDKADIKTQIDDLTSERNGLKFTRASQASVDAAKLVATQATNAQKAECGDGSPKQRGPLCRQKEIEEAAALKTLGDATNNKTATDRFDEIGAQLTELRRKQPKGATGPVGAVNPMTELLTGIVGGWAATLTAWQKAAFAVVYDICLVAMVIGIEILGDPKPPEPRKWWWQRQRAGTAPEGPRKPIQAETVVGRVAAIAQPARPKIAASNPSPVASVKRILSNALEKAPGKRVEFAELAGRYRAVAKAEGKRIVTAEQFTTELDAFSKALGLKRKRDAEHLYLLDVQLMTAESSEVS